MTTSETADPLTAQRRAFRDQLVEHGWLLPSRSAVLPGLGTKSVAVYNGLEALLARTARTHFAAQVTPVHFPPVYGSGMLAKTGYVASFPQLIGTIDSFLGGQSEFRSLLSEYEGGGDWGALLASTGYGLVPAACQPLYSSLEGSTVDDSTLYELTGDCFRHEPSEDPMRFVSFRMREYVRLGTEEAAREHRRRWLEIDEEIFAALRLPVQIVPANDPFFGRGGALLAANQRADEAKFEVVTEIYEGTQTAIASANYHGTHFGDDFALSQPDGVVAHSACVGFGMERTILALVRHHGYDLDEWPVEVRSSLGLA